MLGNAVRRQTVINLAQAKSYALGLRFIRRATGLPVDLTGCTITFTMREESRLGGDVALTDQATILDGPLGTSQFAFQAADLNVPAGEYTFSITLKTANDYSTPLMSGVVNIVASDELDTTGTYVGVNPSTSLAVYLEQGDEVTIEVDKMDGFAFEVQQLMATFEADVAAALAAGAADLQAQLTTQQAAFVSALDDNAAAVQAELSGVQAQVDARLDANELAVNAALAANEAAENALLDQVGLLKDDAEVSALAATNAAAAAAASEAAAAQSAIDAANTVSGGVPQASTAQRGIVELATNAEAVTGTDIERAVTPAGVKAVIDALVGSAPGTLDTIEEIAARIAELGTVDDGLTASIAGKVGKDLVDAKGDLLVGSAADTVVRLPVGATTGHVLTVDPAESTGMKWAAAAGGGGESYPLTPATPDFDFTSGYAGLSLQGYVAGDVTIADGRLKVATGKASTNYFYVAAPAGDFTATMKASVMSAAAGTMFGILGVNTGGSGCGALAHSGSPDGVLAAYLQATGAYDGIQANNTTIKGTTVFQGISAWYRFRRAGTTCYASMSFDGHQWTPEASTAAAAFANINRIGFGCAAGTAPSKFMVDFFDVV